MAACSEQGTGIRRRLSGKQPDPRNSPTGSFPSNPLDVQDLGMSNLCDEQGSSTPQGQQSSRRNGSTPRPRWSKTSSPGLNAPGVSLRKQSNMDINDIGNITASQEHSLFLATFDSDTPMRDGAAPGLDEQPG